MLNVAAHRSGFDDHGRKAENGRWNVGLNKTFGDYQQIEDEHEAENDTKYEPDRGNDFIQNTAAIIHTI